MKLPGFVSLFRASSGVEAVLLVVVLAMGVAGLLLWQTVSRAEDEQAPVEKRVTQARDELAALRLANEKGQLTAELERLKAQPGGGGGSRLSRQDALNRSSALLAYAAQRQLSLSTFSREDTLFTLGETKLPAFGLSLELEGPAEDLLGLLSLVDGFPEMAVQSLEMTRNTTGEGRWGAKVQVLVPYE